jgi:hypothetical protein
MPIPNQHLEPERQHIQNRVANNSVGIPSQEVFGSGVVVLAGGFQPFSAQTVDVCFAHAAS